MKKSDEKTSYGVTARLGIFFVCFLLTFGVTASGILCLVTAFALPVKLEHLLLFLGLGSLAATLLYGLRRGWLLVLAGWLLAVPVVWLWGLEPLVQSCKVVYTALFTVYARAYQIVGSPDWAPEAGAMATQVLTLWGLLSGCVVAWTLRRRQSLMAALLFSLLPLVLCLVVVDTPPDVPWLLAFLVFECLLIVTQGCRRRSPRQGARLAMAMAVPLTAVLLGVYALLPQEGYVRSAMGQRLLQTAVDFTSRFVSIDAELLGDLDVRVPVSRVESLEVGPRRDSTREVMRVLADTGDVLYLRGVTYGVYTGTAWEQIPAGEYPEGASQEGLTIQNQRYGFTSTVTISTTVARPVIYTPYYIQALPDVGQAMEDYGIENTESLRSYSLSFRASGTLSSQTLSTDGDKVILSPYDQFVHRAYTALPEETKARALEIAAAWDADKVSPENLPNYLAMQISRSARYDLNTPRMPQGADFAIWFLTESDTGYCVHYATAAVVMLRAMGIPARYVTGYLCQGGRNTYRSVTGQNAHAWAEYYVDGVGWVPLEATPGGGVASTANPSQTEPTTAPTTEPTVEPTTEPTTAPTIKEITYPTTAPETSGTQREDDAPARTHSGIHIPAWVWWALGAVALFLLRRPVTRAVVRAHRRRKEPNQYFLSGWRAACRLAEALRQPEAHRDLALKARFSQHVMSSQEQETLSRWQTGLLEDLKKAPWYRRFLIRWVRILDVF